MVNSCDVGSLPFVGDLNRFLEGASNYGRVINDSTQFFEKILVRSFLNKVEAGIDVPNYPQYRDMTQMFFEAIEGVAKVNGTYVETAELTLEEGMGAIPEVSAIQNSSREIYEKLGQPFQLRICITGPYTMSSLFAVKNKGIFTRLGNVLTQIIESNIFSSKHGKVSLVSVDEPAFGFIDDPLLDRGSIGRENLLKAWESMMQGIRTKGAQTCLHLHNTSDELFWEVKGLSMIESHVYDPFYEAERTKERLESMDKSVKASVAVTDFDQLIRSNIIAQPGQKLRDSETNEKIAGIWKSLNKNQIDPTIFVEKASLMKERLSRIISLFGENRVPYAGPECGFRSFPTYESALECLRRVSKTVKGS
jgi:5-methyltetrahydropteroyltriglutamate--homocysteine methyltransferase